MYRVSDLTVAPARFMDPSGLHFTYDQKHLNVLVRSRIHHYSIHHNDLRKDAEGGTPS